MKNLGHSLVAILIVLTFTACNGTGSDGHVIRTSDSFDVPQASIDRQAGHHVASPTTGLTGPTGLKQNLAVPVSGASPVPPSQGAFLVTQLTHPQIDPDTLQTAVFAMAGSNEIHDDCEILSKVLAHNGNAESQDCEGTPQQCIARNAGVAPQFLQGFTQLSGGMNCTSMTHLVDELNTAFARCQNLPIQNPAPLVPPAPIPEANPSPVPAPV